MIMVPWVIFDFDGTLTKHRSGWKLIHALYGTDNVTTEREQSFRKGNLGFAEWAEEDIKDWIQNGATRSDIKTLSEAVVLTDGTQEVLEYLNKQHINFGVLSGGIEQLIKCIEPFDPQFIHSNPLLFDEDDSLEGVKKRVGPSQKGECLRELSYEHGFDLDNVIYVGDSYSDLEAMEVVGTSILFNPSKKLDAEEIQIADEVFRGDDLSAIIKSLDPKRTS